MRAKLLEKLGVLERDTRPLRLVELPDPEPPVRSTATSGSRTMDDMRMVLETAASEKIHSPVANTILPTRTRH